MNTATTTGGGVGRVGRWTALALPIVIAAAVIWVRWPEPAPSRIDVASTAAAFATLDDLVSASDLVVVGHVVGAADGRAITDPSDPTVGIRTTVYELRVDRALAGPAVSTVTVEHETALLDGTPITIDGVTPPRNGEAGVYFLIAGTGDEFPHHALIGPQGRLRIDGTVVATSAADRLSRSLDGLSLDEIEARVRDLD